MLLKLSLPPLPRPTVCSWFFRNSKPDTNRVKALLKLSDFYLNKTIDPKRDLDSALVLVRQAEELSKSLNLPKGWKMQIS
jgi:nitrogen fixation protein